MKTEDDNLNEHAPAGSPTVHPTRDDLELAAPTKATSYHMGLDVRGALTNWTLEMFRELLRKEDGRYMDAFEAKAALLDELMAGHEILPFGEACDRWDWKEGCLGHPKPQESGPASSTST